MKAKKLIINWEEQKLVSSVNWQTWDVEIAEGNTKTFFLNGNQDIETAQAAADWLAAWWNPIINYNDVSFILTNSVLSGWSPVE
jgi:hypothetical protein